MNTNGKKVMFSFGIICLLCIGLWVALEIILDFCLELNPDIMKELEKNSIMWNFSNNSNNINRLNLNKMLEYIKLI